MAGLRPIGVKIGAPGAAGRPFRHDGRRAAIHDLQCPYRQKSWMARLARHDVVATAVSPTCYLAALGACARNDEEIACLAPAESVIPRQGLGCRLAGGNKASLSAAPYAPRLPDRRTGRGKRSHLKRRDQPS